MALAFVFPGQGSQAPGMGRDLAVAFSTAREVFEEVDEALKQKLSRLMFEGPGEELTLTANAQPALMAHSIAVLRVLEKEGGFALPEKVVLVAGHSLGEYSALTAARAFDLATAARLLRLRGEAMQRATPPGTGAMAALLGAELEQAQAICEAARTDPETGATEVVEVANDNGGGQVVISGHKAAVERAATLAKERGAKRALMLPVSAPFHSALMQPAAAAMAEALAAVEIAAPAVPLVANVRAEPVAEPGAIRRLLVEQVTGAVRWRESVEFLAGAGVTEFWEIGAGKALSGMIKRIAKDAAVRNIGAPADIAALKA